MRIGGCQTLGEVGKGARMGVTVIGTGSPSGIGRVSWKQTEVVDAQH